MWWVTYFNIINASILLLLLQQPASSQQPAASSQQPAASSQQPGFFFSINEIVYTWGNKKGRCHSTPWVHGLATCIDLNSEFKDRIWQRLGNSADLLSCPEQN